MEIDKLELAKSIQAARHFARLEGQVFVVAKPIKSYHTFEVASLVDHYTHPEHERPDIMFAIFPDSTVNTLISN